MSRFSKAIVRPVVLALWFAAASAPAAEQQPLGQWIFTPGAMHDLEVRAQAGTIPGKLQRKTPLADAGQTMALQCDGGANAVTVGDKLSPAAELRTRLTAEAWVRIDEFRRWSRFVGVVARQQDQRKGWFIGTHEHRFVFALGAEGTKGQMTDLHSGGSAHPGHWYHVAGTYDGHVMRLYVNGLLVGESKAETGAVVLPTDTPLSIVDYHDGAEFYPLRGMLHEVTVYNQALSEAEIRQHYVAKAKLLTAAPPLEMSGCFGENMVLQRDAELPVWGQTFPGDKISVSCAGQQASTVAGPDGLWRLTLPKLAAGGPHEFAIETPHGSMVHRNVLVGEVWFCAGQSNLALGTRRTRDYGLARQPFPQMRFFTVVREGTPAPVRFTGGWWEACDAGTAAEFSAVGFYFGRKIHQELHVPVGLFNASWGGTPVESWISRDAMQSLPEMAPVLKKESEDKWERSGLFDQMVHPLIPFAMRGVLWYQGEGNVGNAQFYESRFSLMIRDWRKRWGQGDFPFYYVQIAPFNYGGNFNVACAEVWDAQRKVLALPNTGMAVATDATQIHDNHASNKRVIGERLALWALAKTYGHDQIVYSGPLYKGMKIEGDKVRIYFDHLGGGLKSRDGKTLDWFSIAGEDRKFVPAQAKIEADDSKGSGQDSIVVHSPDVKNPVAVRFAWSGIAQPNLTNKADLPASPFRTDGWPGILEKP
ncbi:MAG: hypothetical protein K8T25_12710 [Planctomycetia bacterium]|nr:hypothetical protein [Planctomycetia bacterium]